MDDVQLAKGDGPKFDQAKFTGAAKHIHERQEFTPQMMQDEPVKALTRETYTALSAAINIGREVPPELRVALEENTFIFSGFKTYQQLREVSGLLKDEDGGFKSFEAFSRDIQQLNDRYNKNYLRAEYNYATQSTQMAVKWHDFVADGDDYLLQYRTSGDDRVRAEHAALHGVTLPIGDAFWDEYLPPLDWGCRCTVVQVPREKYQQSDPDEAKALGEAATAGPKKKIFRFNPGKTMKIFPPKHPYYKVPEEEKEVVKDAITGFVETEFTAKTIEEAEQLFKDKLGVNCSLKGFKKKDLEQVKDIFRSVDAHFQMFPELRTKTHYVGSISGRIQLLTDALIKDWEQLHGMPAPEYIRKFKASSARRIASCKGCYAYSHGACSEYGLDGIAFNTAWAGQKIVDQLDADMKAKWHPIGCNTVKSVIDHELGHEADRLLGLRTDPEFLLLYRQATSNGQEYIKENLSQYANKGNSPVAEFIAEAWSEYLNNKEPRQIARSVGLMIEKKTGLHKDDSSTGS